MSKDETLEEKLDREMKERQQMLREWAPEAVALKNKYAADLFIPEIDAPEEWDDAYWGNEEDYEGNY